MPTYEGSEEVWERHKAQVLKQTVMNPVTVVSKGPIEQLNELFAEITKYEFVEDPKKRDTFFKCQVTIGEDTYEGIGMNKKEAKVNAAANAVEGLQAKGVYDKRVKELEEKRQAKEAKMKTLEGADPDKGIVLKYDKKGHPLIAKNAVSRLNEMLPGLEYKIIGQVPLRNTCLTAFAVAVNVKGRNFVGIGKNKKLAKLECAEKAMKALGYWSQEDELVKMQSMLGDRAAAAYAAGFDPNDMMGGQEYGTGMGMGGAGFGPGGPGYGRGVMGSMPGRAGRGSMGGRGGMGGMGGREAMGASARGKITPLASITPLVTKSASGVPGLFDDLRLDAQYDNGDNWEPMLPTTTHGRGGSGRGSRGNRGGGMLGDSGWGSGYCSDLQAVGGGGVGFGYYSGWESGYGGEVYGEGGEEGLDTMIDDLSTILASIVESNPGVGIGDIWQMLQDNQAYKSWQGGDLSGFKLLGERMIQGYKVQQQQQQKSQQNYTSLMSGAGGGSSGPAWGMGGSSFGTGSRARGARGSKSGFGSSGASFRRSSGAQQQEQDWTTDWSVPSGQGFSVSGGFGNSGFHGQRGARGGRGRRGMF